MRRLHLLGLAFIGSLAFAQLAAAQETPPAKEKAASPFEDGKKDEGRDDKLARELVEHIIQATEPIDAEKTLEERLEAKASFQGQGGSLKNFGEALEKALDAPVIVGTKKLEEAAINVETPLTYKLKNVRVKTALKLILSDLGLTYVLHDNVIVITTLEDAGSQLVTRVYDCRELLKLPSPIKKAKQPKTPRNRQEIGTTGLPAQVPEKKEEAGPDGDYEVADLIDVITTTVSPDSWDEVGGPGSLKDFKGLITVSQTQEVHEDVEQLLNMLHKAGGLEEKVKVSR